MLYYNINNLGNYTNNEKLAKLKVERGEWEDYGVTNEEIVIQDNSSEYVLKSEWVADLQKAKNNKIAELKEERNKREVLPLEYNNNIFDVDKEFSLPRIQIAMTAVGNGSINWTTYNGDTVEMTLQDFNNLLSLMAQRSNELHIKYRELKETVTELNSIEDIDSIEWGQD